MMLSIRWRLTLWNTLGLAVMLLGFAGLIYGLLRHALYEQIDERLLTAVGQLVRDRGVKDQPDERLRHWIYEWQEHENITAVAYADDGTFRERTEQLAVAAIPANPAVTAGEQHFEDRTVPILGRQRILEQSLQIGEQISSIVLMAPLADADHELAELRTVLLMAVPAVLILSGGLGYMLARKALAPMERLRRSAEEITADRLDRRLLVRNPQDELGRLTETFNAMFARLERSFAEIRRFTADASHELRTPLTVIRTEAEVALAKPLDLAEHQQLLGSILEECERLTRLTDQLLALAREDARASRPVQEPVDLSALVRDVVDTMRPLADTKALQLRSKFNGPVSIRGDGNRLREVFFNVLDNAIKYCQHSGEVEVHVKRHGPNAVVSVRDTGIGIPAEHLPHIFERFYRVDKARSRAEGGTGLGLSIALSIVIAHGGQIELESRPGRGSTCTVVLPTDGAPQS
jgi:two-component system, OmpR family, heavy metal sensor histidine kinase CusS